MERAHALRQALDKGIVHGVMHVDPVRADAGLAAVAELGRHQAVDRGVEVGIVEHDERCIAAQFQRQLLQRRGGFTRQMLAHRRGAGEGDLAHAAVGQPGIDHARRVLPRGRDHVEHA
ncbi:hypothetical protein D3C72_1326500 [compost metagenome]